MSKRISEHGESSIRRVRHTALGDCACASRLHHRAVQVVHNHIEMHRCPMAVIPPQISACRTDGATPLFFKQIDQRVGTAQFNEAAAEPSGDPQPEGSRVKIAPCSISGTAMLINRLGKLDAPH